MSDEIFMDAHEKLTIETGKEPSYEEVIDYLNSIYKEKNYERKLHKETLLFR